MMDPIALQKQLRNNSDDLLSTFEDLKKWTGEMNLKENGLKPKPEKLTSKETTKAVNSSLNNPKKKVIKSTDYSAWDKFDVEAACAKLDKPAEDEDSDEKYDDEDVEDDSSALDEAQYHKEKGNQYVKLQKWDRAIDCYTNAIKNYGYDAIYYANRGLCYLKQKNYHSAETDCTAALQLDKTYVKAYQRRASARESLGHLADAKADLMKVFDYEPNNKESKSALKRIEAQLEKSNKKLKAEKSDLKVRFQDTKDEVPPSQKVVETQRPKSKFALEREAAKERKAASSAQNQKLKENSAKCLSRPLPIHWPSGNAVELVQPIQKPPHLRSKKPLKRIEVSDLENKLQPKEPKTENNVDFTNEMVNNLQAIEKNLPGVNKIEDVKVKKVEDHELVVPSNYVNFIYSWKLLNQDLRWKYLSKINPKNLPTLFKESLESEVFGEIIHTLSQFCNKNALILYEYLLGLSNIKRFSVLVMFLSEKETNEIKELLDVIMENQVLSNEEINSLMKKYGF